MQWKKNLPPLQWRIAVACVELMEPQGITGVFAAVDAKVVRKMGWVILETFEGFFRRSVRFQMLYTCPRDQNCPMDKSEGGSFYCFDTINSRVPELLSRVPSSEMLGCGHGPKT